MKALILCGYRAGTEPIGTERDERGQTAIDRSIARLSAIGFEVVCVVSGNTADEQLRASRALTRAELVFDGEETPCLASNLKAGLAATDGEGCFAIPVEIPVPESELWHFMREQWRTIGFLTESSVLQTVSEGAPWHFGFPLLITRSGNGLIQNLDEFHSLVDTRLKYLHLQLEEHAGLASRADAL